MAKCIKSKLVIYVETINDGVDTLQNETVYQAAKEGIGRWVRHNMGITHTDENRWNEVWQITGSSRAERRSKLQAARRGKGGGKPNVSVDTT